MDTQSTSRDTLSAITGAGYSTGPEGTRTAAQAVAGARAAFAALPRGPTAGHNHNPKSSASGHSRKGSRGGGSGGSGQSPGHDSVRMGRLGRQGGAS